MISISDTQRTEFSQSHSYQTGVSKGKLLPGGLKTFFTFPYVNNLVFAFYYIFITGKAQ